METYTIIYWGYIGILEKKHGNHWGLGFIGYIAPPTLENQKEKNMINNNGK